MLLLYSFIGMARAEIVEIGTDGGTTTNNYLPAYTFYNYNLTEQIYTADEIGMAGTISSIAFYNGGEVKTPNLKIYMVNTDKDVFSNSTDWFTVTAADLVFEGSVTMTANAWTTITLTNEFQYDGNSNLGLIVDEYMQYNSGLACRVYTSTSNCSLYAYNDSNDYSPLSPPTSFGSYEYNGILSVKNQIKLDITPSGGSICEKPASLAVSEVTGNSATLTWSGGSGLYNVEYKKVSATQWSTALSNTTALTTNLTNLEAETAYQARVQSVCSDGTSSYRTVNFVVSDKITIGSGTGTSGYLPTNTNYDYSYTQQIYTVEELGAPGFIRSIDFYMTSTTTYTRTLDVYMVSTDKNSFSGTTDWISVTSDDLVFSGSVTFTADSWTTITLNDYGFLYDGTQNVAIIVDDNTNDWDSRYFKTFTTTTNQAHYAYQDDTNINPNAPTAYSNYVTSSKNQIRILKEDLNCMPPTNPTATEITATSAVVTWEGEAESYNINYIGTSFFDNFDNGLNGWTTYKEGDASSDGWYTDNPNNWEGSVTAHSGDYVAWSMQQSSGIHADNWLITPQLELGGTLKFWVSRSNDDGYLDEYEVLLSTNGTAINDFTYTLQEMEVAPKRWTEVSIDLSTYEGQQGYIAIHHDYTNGFFLMIDDFGIYDWTTELVNGHSYTFNNLDPETQQQWQVQAICDDGESSWTRIQSFTTIPTCVAPTGLDVSNITAHSATFTWNAEEGATYRYVLPRNYNPSVDPESLSFNNRVQGGSVTIRNLNADTEYGFFLRRDCGETGYSDIVYVVFRTTVACPAPTDLTVVENSITGHGATLSWTGTSSSYIVNVGELESASTTYNFDNNSIDPAFTNSTTYPWTVTSNDKHSGNYSIKSGGAGTNNAQSDLTLIVNIVNDATVSFWSKVSSESTDYGRFLIDNNQKFQVSGTSNNWTQYSYELDPGTHTLVWRYYKDYSVHSGDDCFYVDDIVIGSDAVSSWTTFTATESPFILYDAEQIHPETPYMVIIQGDCGSEGLSLETEPFIFTTIETCPKPTDLTYSTVTATTAILNWTENGQASTWQICLNGDEENLIEVNTNENYLLEGLTPVTQYTVKVRTVCDEEESSLWSNEVSFTTTETCPMPTNITITNITAVTADMNWEGSLDVDSYTVKYRGKSGVVTVFSEDFNNGIDGWTMQNCSSGTGTNNNGQFHFAYSVNPPQYLISPEISGITEEAMIEFEYLAEFGDIINEFIMIGTSSTNNQIGSFNWGEEITVDGNELSNYQGTIPAGTKYIAIRCNTNDGWDLIIDNIVVGFEITASEWQVETTTETHMQLTNLLGGREYEVQMRSDCLEDDWSDVINFSTLPEGTKVFVTEGEWNMANNWIPTGAPTIGESAILRANVTITGVAEASTITFEGSPTPTITINDGGQLRTNTNIRATVKKNFMGYGADNIETNNGYYLIATPTSAALNLANSGLITTVDGQATYDLYSWNRTAQDNEWRNYRNSTFSILNGTGYLYANLNDIEMSFTSNLLRSDLPINKTPDYDATAGGWNLYGNPFPCDAYLSTQAEGMAFYRLSGNTFVAATGAIAPMEGFFAQATATGQTFTISREAPAKHGQLNMSLNHDGNTIDNALIIFGEGQNLGKMSFRENSSKVYMPVEGKDYAAVFTSNAGEMPVSFKAEENGSFTLSFTNSNVEFSYLHLIDTLTGADIDLLQTPSYSFEASTNDNVNRFKVVFATR